MSKQWWANTPLDPVDGDEIDSARDGYDLALTVGGGAAQVLTVLGADNFPCLDEEQREAFPEEVIALGKEVVRRFNGFPALLKACEELASRGIADAYVMQLARAALALARPAARKED